jgi:uncharacterized protein YukE
MAVTDVRVDPEMLHTAGQSLIATGDDFAARLADFQSRAAAFDGAWGGDAIGTYIGIAYAAVSDWAFSCWEIIAEELALAGEDLDAMATSYEDVEAEAATGLGAIAKLLG